MAGLLTKLGIASSLIGVAADKFGGPKTQKNQRRARHVVDTAKRIGKNTINEVIDTAKFVDDLRQGRRSVDMIDPQTGRRVVDPNAVMRAFNVASEMSMPAIGHKPSMTIARMGKGEAEEAIKKGFDDKLKEVSELIDQRYNYLRDHELPPLSDGTLAKMEGEYAQIYANRDQILEAVRDMPQEFLDDIPSGKLMVRDLQDKVPEKEKGLGYVVRGTYGRGTKNVTLDPIHANPSTVFHEGGIHRRQDVWGLYPKENMKWVKIKPEHRKAYLKNRLVMEFQKQLDPKIGKLKVRGEFPYSAYKKQPLEDPAHIIDRWVVNYKKKHGKPPTEDAIMKKWEKRLDKYIDTWIKTSRKGHPKMRQALKNAVDEVEKHVEFANKTMGSEFFKPVIKKTKKK